MLPEMPGKPTDTTPGKESGPGMSGPTLKLLGLSNYLEIVAQAKLYFARSTGCAGNGTKPAGINARVGCGGYVEARVVEPIVHFRSELKSMGF